MKRSNWFDIAHISLLTFTIIQYPKHAVNVALLLILGSLIEIKNKL